MSGSSWVTPLSELEAHIDASVTAKAAGIIAPPPLTSFSAPDISGTDRMGTSFFSSSVEAISR